MQIFLTFAYLQIFSKSMDGCEIWYTMSSYGILHTYQPLKLSLVLAELKSLGMQINMHVVFLKQFCKRA